MVYCECEFTKILVYAKLRTPLAYPMFGLYIFFIYSPNWKHAKATCLFLHSV